MKGADLLPALNRTVEIARQRAAGRIPIVGIGGAQGAGKTTLLQALQAEVSGVAAFSIDDVYRTGAQRAFLSRDVHPLAVTRGPPGTHDLDLLNDTLRALLAAGEGSRTPIASFDKAADERRPASQWPVFEGRPEAIILDGWCLGALPQAPAELSAPVNALERFEDPAGTWRRWVNARLTDYQPMFARLDAILYLAAPSFDVVLDWRLQQEAQTLGREMTDDDRARIARFIAHYERLTRHMLAGGRRSEVTVRLDADRAVLGVDYS